MVSDFEMVKTKKFANVKADAIILCTCNDNNDYLNFVKEIYSIIGNPHIIIVSDCSNIDKIIKLLKMGIDCCLLEDFSEEELLSAIDHVINNKRYLNSKAIDILVSNSIDITEKLKDIYIKLNDTEKKILFSLAEGKKLETIADEIGKGKKYICLRKNELMKKFEANSISELIAKTVLLFIGGGIEYYSKKANSNLSATIILVQ